MFDPIKTHIDPYRGPAQGEGTEHGDTWPTAIQKINKGFENIIAWIESFDTTASAKLTEAALTAQDVGDIVQRALQPLQDQLNEVRREIESRQTPLGRVLINHNVLRQVELVQLWRIMPGPDLRTQLAIPADVPTVYGRTALIHCNGQPAVELLEVVVD